MKKIKRLQPLLKQLWLVLFFALLVPNPALTAKAINHYRSYYKAAILADAESGRILHHDRMHQKIYPASLVKLMVALIALEEMKKGNISLQDRITVSRWASKIGGHQVYLKQGEVFPFSELMKAMVISSANDASVAVAEHVAGSDDEFIKLMNQRADELGMKNTEFHSVHGLPPGRGQKLDVSTAYDFYLLAMETLKHPKYFEWSSTRLSSLRQGKFQLLNTNHRLIRNYKGMEGMKTGYHRLAGFNLISAAKRDGQRYISVVIGSPNDKWRRKATTHLLDHGFSNYSKVDLNKKDSLTTYTVSVQGGEVDVLTLLAKEPAVILLSPEEQKRLEIWTKIPPEIKAPINKGQSIGSLEYWLDGRILKEVALHASTEIPEQGILSGLTGMITDWGNGAN